MQGTRRFGEVEPPADGFAHIAELLEIHLFITN